MSPHPVTLRQLQYVVAVAETGSFRRAAERCRVAQPSLSMQIAEVERALGVRLFERDRRRVLVTAAGEALLPRARTLLVAADDLVAAAARLGDPLAGTLRIGVIPTVSPYLCRRSRRRCGLRCPGSSSCGARTRRRRWWRGCTRASSTRRSSRSSRTSARSSTSASARSLLDCRRKRASVGAFGASLGAEQLRGQELLLLAEGHCLRDQALSACGRGRRRESPFGATS